MESVNCSKQCYTSITYSKTEHIPYNLIFAIKCNDSSTLITIISWGHLNLSLTNEYVVDVTIPTQVIMYNQCCSRKIRRSDCIKLKKMNCELMLTYDTPVYMFNVHKNQPSRQTGSRNLMGSKTLPTLLRINMKIVTKYQISAINSC